MLLAGALMATDLRYHGLVTGMADPHNDRRGPRLQVATPKGLVREVPVDRHELVRIIASAARALEHLDRLENRP